MSAPRLFGQPPADAELDVATLLERVEEGMAICDAHGRIVMSNGAWRAVVGPAPDALRCQDGLFAPFLRARREGWSDGRLTARARDQPVRIACMGGDRFLLRLVAPLPAPVDAVAAPRLHAALQASPTPFAAAIIAPGDPFQMTILEANPKLGEIAGLSVSASTTLGDLLTPATRADAAARAEAGHDGAIEVIMAGPPHRAAHLYLSRGPSGTTAYLLDVTEQKSMQAQLAQRNKMEAIGQLAGGVAHDFNNLLTAIRLRADELLLRHPLGDPSYDNLAEIRDTVLRAAGLVRQLLTFSRKATTKRETFDLCEALIDFEILLRRLLREDVRLETNYDRSTPQVRADRAQIETAIMNLVVNARDAVRASGGGTIALRCAGLDGKAASELGYAGPPAVRVAMIEVADDGPGVPAKDAAHIFEPFFTTKGVGEGTGLGLATVYGVVKQAEGWITLVSPKTGGAVFRIFLPAAAPVLVLEPEPAPPPRSAARDMSGVGRILLVEDEPLVRGITARLLRTRGYEVLEAADGEAALEIAEAEAGRIDLMISDVIMPGMDGPTLLKAARPYLAGAPVMFISGYAESDFSDLLEGETNVSFLAKPLDIVGLAEQVKLRLRRP